MPMVSPKVRDVPELWFGAEFFLQPKDLLVGENVADLAGRIEQVAEDARAGGAGLHTGRLPPLARALRAHVALLGDAARPRAVTEVVGYGIDLGRRNLRLGPVEVTRPVGTGRHAVAAADAPVVVDDDDPIGLLPGGLHRACLDAGRVLALHALDRHVELAFDRDRGGVVVVLGGLQVHRPLVHLQHADVPHLRVTSLIVLLDAPGDAVPVALALGDVQRVAEQGAGDRRGILAGDVDAVAALGAALDAAQSVLDLRRRHALVVVLEEAAQRILERLPAPGRLSGSGHRRGARQRRHAA